MSAQEDAVVEAVVAFLATYDQCEDAIRGAFSFQQNHGITYSGPTYEKELADLHAAISAYKAMAEMAGRGSISAPPSVERITHKRLSTRAENLSKMLGEHNPAPDEVIEECAKIADAEGLSPNASVSYCAAAFHIGMCIRPQEQAAEYLALACCIPRMVSGESVRP